MWLQFIWTKSIRLLRTEYKKSTVWECGLQLNKQIWGHNNKSLKLHGSRRFLWEHCKIVICFWWTLTSNWFIAGVYCCTNVFKMLKSCIVLHICNCARAFVWVLTFCKCTTWYWYSQTCHIFLATVISVSSVRIIQWPSEWSTFCKNLLSVLLCTQSRNWLIGTPTALTLINLTKPITNQSNELWPAQPVNI